MTGGLVKGNKAGCGGGIYTNNTSNSISGGTITENEATVEGGGIYAGYRLLLTGVEISLNKSAFAGAVAAYKDALTLGENVYIPWGAKIENGTLVKAAGMNDLGIVDGEGDPNEYVTLSANLSKHSKEDPIALTRYEWKRGKTVIQADGTNVTDLTPYENFFELTQSDWIAKASTNKIYIDAPIYVAGTGRDDTGDGTKAKPYATIAKAIELLTDKDTDYTIYIDGTISGAQTIPSTLKSDGNGIYNARSVVICGATGNTTDILNGGFIQTANGTTLKILTDVPVTIKNLKITGGYAAGAGGGGIYAKGDVTLSEGALVSGNYTASCGGGIYNDSGTLSIESGAEVSVNHEMGVSNCGGGGIFNYKGTLVISGGVIKTNSAEHDGGAIYTENGTCYIYGDTLIGKDVTAAPSEWYYGSNTAENGGAIYNKSGNIYIGYKNNNGTPSKDDEASVKIMGNAVKTSSSKGGGIYVAAGAVQIAKTCIGFNYSPYSGAGIYTKVRVNLLEDAIIKGNKAFSFGGGVYIDQGGQLGMGGNSIIGGSESGDANTAAKGGGVYVSSSAQTTPASVTFGAANSTQSIMGNSSTLAGGGVYINGLYATFTMHSGVISNNKLVGGETGGGGIHVAEGTLNFEGGEISGNVIETPSNTNIKGGAIDIGTSGKFNIKGAVSIPYGGETGKNDVRINTSTAITITGAITDTDTDIRVIPYSYLEGETVLALADGVTNTTIAKTKRKFSIMPDPAHPENDWHINSEGNLTLLYIGSKKPSEDKAIGDIIFNDGSAEYYSDLNDEQKNAAIAVIFYNGVGDSKLGNRVLGVALNDSSSTLAWASTYAKGHGSGPQNSTPPIPVEKYNGKTNFAAIKALGDYKQSYYPAFYYAEHYGDSASNLGDYTEDWYLPAYEELYKIYTNKSTVNAAFEKLGLGSSIKMFTTQNKRRYWSSTNYFTSSTTYSQNDKYGIQTAWAWDEDRFKGNAKENGNICYVRVIHEF